MPGMQQYLHSICAVSPGLTLHQALKEQLASMQALSRKRAAGSVEPLMQAVHSLTTDAALKGMAEQSARGRLSEDVDCFELLGKLCSALHEEFMGLQEALPDLDEGASYWAGLLSMESQEVRYCSVHKQCENQASPRRLPWQAVHVQCAPLVAGAGTGQLLCNVLQHHMRVNMRQCGPCTAHQQKKMAQGRTARPEAVIYDTIQAVRLPVVLLVSIWSLQDVGLDAATASILGLTKEDVQQPELASKPNLRLQDTLELDEYPEHKASSRTVIVYRLVAVVFRSGGFTSGHFYLAVQASPDSWVVLNSEQTSGPYTLDEVQAIHGKNIYGTAYLRMDMPVVGGRQSLGRWLHQQQNSEAVRACTSLNIAQPSPAAESSPSVGRPQLAGPSSLAKQSPGPSVATSGMKISLDLLLAKSAKKSKKPLQHAQRTLGAATTQQAATTASAGRPSRLLQHSLASEDQNALERVKQLRAERKAEEAAKARGQVYPSPQQQQQQLAAKQAIIEKAQQNAVLRQKREAKKAAKQRERQEAAAQQEAALQKAAEEQVAATQAAADKVVADKAAADRAAADKAAADKVAADKAAADKVAADKAAADKAAADKVAADKVAAEQAAVQVAASKQAVANNAAAERAAVEATLQAVLEAAAVQAAAEADAVEAAAREAAVQAALQAVVETTVQAVAEAAAEKAAQQAAANRAAAEEEAAEKTGADKTAEGKHAAQKAAAAKAAMDKSSAGKAAADHVATDQDAEDKAAGDRDASETAAQQQVANKAATRQEAARGPAAATAATGKHAAADKAAAAAASQQQGTQVPTIAWSLAANYTNAREGPAAARQQRDVRADGLHSPRSPSADHSADAAADHAGQHDRHMSRAAAAGLWGRSKKLAGQAVTELAVATVVLPVVLPTLAVLMVPAGMWAGACLTRVACKNVFGF